MTQQVQLNNCPDHLQKNNAEQAFSISSPTTWNSIPQHMRVLFLTLKFHLLKRLLISNHFSASCNICNCTVFFVIKVIIIIIIIIMHKLMKQHTNEILPWWWWHSEKLIKARPILAKRVFWNHEDVFNKWIWQQPAAPTQKKQHKYPINTMDYKLQTTRITVPANIFQHKYYQA